MRIFVFSLVVLIGIVTLIGIFLINPVTIQPVYATANFTPSSNVSLDLWAPEDLEAALTNAFLEFSSNFSAEFSESLGNAIISSMNMTIQEFIDALDIQKDDALNYIMIFILCVLITGLAFWRQEAFLDIMATIVDLIFGIIFASTQVLMSPGWVEGLILAIIGTWILLHRIRVEFREARKRRQ